MNLKKTNANMSSRSHQFILLLSLGLLSSACAEDSLTVGHSRATEGDGEANPIIPAEDCREEDEWARTEYNEWKSARVKAKELFGTHWEGNRFQLIIDEKGQVNVRFDDGDDLHPVSGDQGFLCGFPDSESEDPIFETDPNAVRNCVSAHYSSVLYPANEITFVDEVLSFRIQGAGAWEEWCEVQTPYPSEHGACSFQPYETILNSPTYVESGSVASAGPEGCYIYDQEVDCDWFAMVIDAGICQCASDGCFLSVNAAGGELFEFKLSEDGTELLDADGVRTLTRLQ